MSSSENDDEALPDGWVLCQSKSNPGRKYFFNKKTGKSSWTRPEAVQRNNSKNRKEDTKQDRGKKEEIVMINLKRKSDGCQQEPSPKKKVFRVSDTQTPDTSQCKKPIPNSVRNSANKRLSQLRSRLSQEAQKEESSTQIKSPIKAKKDKPETQTNNTKTPELKSPTSNDSKCSNRRDHESPSSDSITSIPSPSQFLAANKIISSMKAQLPEEYSHRVKHKDTFADIEEGIWNQTPEYPSMKHPATPPQFSQASKIVSAIKSKLSYKSSGIRDFSDVQVYSKAKERMEALRTSLSEPSDDSTSKLDVHNEVVLQKQSSVEAMEIEESRIAPQTSSPETCESPPVTEDFKENAVLVVDTNIFIHELDVIKNVLNSHIKGFKEQPTLLVPWRVINELDRLKDNNNGNGAICKRAKAAMDYLYQSLPENDRIKGQPLRDANSHIYPCELPDDEILNCCLQQAERGKSVILVSNDKNLCNKACVNGVRTWSAAALRRGARAAPTAARDMQGIHALLTRILQNEMRAKYDTLWHHVIVKPPPWSLRDVCECLLKHWVAVFNEVFPRIEHLIQELKTTVDRIEDKDPKTLSPSDVNRFKDLSLEIAKKCQIIPEYMELAKKTVEMLTKKSEPVPDAAEEARRIEVLKRDEMMIVAAFENVWTVFSSYCAKLASQIGVPHDIEDKLNSNDPLDVLTDKCIVLTNLIADFNHALQGILNTPPDCPSALSDHIPRLETVFKDSLKILSSDAAEGVNKDNLRLFCTNCRNMLQEAYTKFSQLEELLNLCRSVLNK